MTVAVWVMLGSAATSAACCLMPRAQATPRAQANAMGMLTVMVLAITVPSVFVLRAGALILLTLAAGIGLGLADADYFQQRARAVEAHRATGSVLTAAALLLHQHMGQAATQILLQAATVAYAAWTVVAVVRSDTSMTPRLRWEHIAMATSLGAMVFAGNHLVM